MVAQTEQAGAISCLRICQDLQSAKGLQLRVATGSQPAIEIGSAQAQGHEHFLAIACVIRPPLVRDAPHSLGRLHNSIAAP